MILADVKIGGTRHALNQDKYAIFENPYFPVVFQDCFLSIFNK